MSSPAPPVDPGARERLTRRFGLGIAPWLDALPGRLAALADEWRLVVGDPIPRGSVSAVYWCRLTDGRPAVLKASPDRARLAFEAAALAAWPTTHTPAVIALDESVGALLIEAIEPGTPLVVSTTYPTVERFAELMNALHDTGVSDPVYRTVARWVDHLFDSSARLYDWYPNVAAVVPPQLYARGRALAGRLAQDQLPTVLLHGDLTPSNVLDGGAARGLVAVDPAPCLGDAAFDAVDLLLWQADDLATIEARAMRLASATGLGADRLLAWCAAFAAMTALELASQGNPGPARLDALLTLATRAPVS